MYNSVLFCLWLHIIVAFGEYYNSSLSGSNDTLAMPCSNLTLYDKKNESGSTNCSGCCGAACPSFPEHVFISQGIRTAVIISGQLRTANVTFASGHMLRTREYYWFGSTDAPSPAGTIIENLFKVLWSQGPFDVFMHLQADPSNNETWNGEPWTYREKLGDDRGCKIFSDHPIFHGTGNKFFCMIEPEQKLMTKFLDENPIWNRYWYIHRISKYGVDYKKKEQYLQQLYSMYRANLGCRQYQLAKNVDYTHKIRLRPDTAVLMPFPLYSQLDFRARTNNICNATIYFLNTPLIKAIGGQDIFNVGLSEHMDNLFSTYSDFVSNSIPKSIQESGEWIAEQMLEENLKEKYHVCMAWHDLIKMVPMRLDNNWRVPKVEWKEHTGDWNELSS